MFEDDTLNIANLYLKIIQEDMTVDGVYGGSDVTDGIVNQDSYAKGDARVPSILGTFTRKGKLKKRVAKSTKKSRALKFKKV